MPSTKTVTADRITVFAPSIAGVMPQRIGSG